MLALKILKANEMDGPPTVLLDLGGEEAAKALIAGTIDAAFLMGDSATPQVMRSLRVVPGIELISFRQAEGYLRRFRFLSRLTLPEGAHGPGQELPAANHDSWSGPTVELVAREDLHPALSDLLIGAAREIHGGPGLFRTAGRISRTSGARLPHQPATPSGTTSPASSSCTSGCRSGWPACSIGCWWWCLPLLVVIVPATRIVPALYRWRVRSRIYRWYGALMAIEREMLHDAHA